MCKFDLPLSMKNIVHYMLTLVCFSFLGCTSVGSVVPVDQMVTLMESQKSQSIFKHGPLTVEYMYSVADGRISLKGNAKYSGGADSLDLRVLFLDATGTVLQKKIVYSSGYRTTRDPKPERNFDKTLDVPVGAVGFSFTYSVKERSGRR